MGLIGILKNHLEAHRHGMQIYDLAMQELKEQEARKQQRSAVQPMSAAEFSQAMQRTLRMPKAKTK